MEKRYQAIFFDWDGTAVTSRSEPPDTVAPLMGALLEKGVDLAVISGTTYENIAGGRLHELFSPSQLEHLYLGLGRGAFNYRFVKGRAERFGPPLPDRETLLRVHKVCFELHTRLFAEYGFPTDIIFSRPNYCKLDLLVDYDRSGQLFFHEGELELINGALKKYGFSGGIRRLIAMTEEIGLGNGLPVRATTDAKFLEVGLTTKSDNVDFLLKALGHSQEACCFFGDEFIHLGDGVYGSDAFMRTPLTEGADFFDVSGAGGDRPEGVTVLGGGVDRFRAFLSEQAELT